MMSLAFHWIVNWLIGWGGISLLVAIGAGVVWWFLPPFAVKARSLAMHVGIGALAYNFAYSMGYQNGATTVRTEWKAAEQRAIDRAKDAHVDAAETIPLEPETAQSCPEAAPAPGVVAPLPRPPRVIPRWMRDDRYHRNDR